MKIGILVAIVAAIVVWIGSANSASSRCNIGKVRAFAHVTGVQRLGGVGGIPNTFNSSKMWFGQRWNCSRDDPLVRRRNVGVYEILFPNNPGNIPMVTVKTDDAASASAYRIGPGSFRVHIRGPLMNNNILLPREVPFYIVVF